MAERSALSRTAEFLAGHAGAGVPAAAEDSGAGLRWAAGEILFLLLLPLAAFFGLHFQPVLQNGTIDPYVYTGYIHNFQDLFQRYGVQYYGVRFGLILPSRLAVWMFGPLGGYFALRYVLALVFAVPIYAVCRRYLSPAVAILIYGIAASSPWLAQTVLWDHPDATGMPFLSAAVCLLLWGGRRPGMVAFLAGCSLGLAGNSNIFTLAIFGAFLGVYGGLWLLSGRSWRPLARQIATAAAGALAVTAAGCLYYHPIVGQWDIFHVTLDMVKSLSTGQQLRWRKAGFAWTLDRYFVYVPVWLSLWCGAAWAARKRSFEAAVMSCYGIAVTAFYYAHQFLLRGDSLNLTFYVSYSQPAVVLMAAVICQQFWEAARMRTAPFLAVGLGCAILPWLPVSFGWTLPVRAGLAAFLLLAVAAAAAWTWRASRTAAIAGLALFCLAYDAGLASYQDAIRRRDVADHSQLDTYRAAIEFIREIPAWKDSGPLLFWYNSRHGNPISDLQATFLWGFSMLPSGLPTLSPESLDLIRRLPARRLCILGESAQELQAGLDALRARGVAFVEEPRHSLDSGSWRIEWELLDLR